MPGDCRQACHGAALAVVARPQIGGDRQSRNAANDLDRACSSGIDETAAQPVIGSELLNQRLPHTQCANSG